MLTYYGWPKLPDALDGRDILLYPIGSIVPRVLAGGTVTLSRTLNQRARKKSWRSNVSLVVISTGKHAICVGRRRAAP